MNQSRKSKGAVLFKFKPCLRRLVRRQEETRAQRGQMKQLKGLMHGLVNVTGDPEKQQLELIRNARQLAFLITDLQDSTAMASANAVAFKKVQDIHDTVSDSKRSRTLLNMLFATSRSDEA